ncbi:MAG: LCP family protein [Halanaerobiales bacterium]
MNENKEESKNTKKWIIILIILVVSLLGFYGYNYFSLFFGEANLQDRFNEEVNLLVIGQDNEDSVEEGTTHSDSIMLINLKPGDQNIDIIAVPSQEKYKDRKLKEYNREQLMDIMSSISDVNPNYYFVIDYEGFKNIVNLMSGIEIELEEEFQIPELGLYLKEGNNLLSGQEALNYARYYDHNKDELNRVSRQRKIIEGFSDKIFQQNSLLNIPRLYRTVMETVKNVNTNLDYDLAIEAYNFISNSEDFNVEYEILDLNSTDE